MLQIIKEKLSDYIEFDSDKIFKNHGDIIRIFGGAIRDIIANQPIRDVDILIGSRSLDRMEELLDMEGYFYMEGLTPKDLSECYSKIQIINEPRTWVKGSKIIQLIKPATDNRKLFTPEQRTKNHSIYESYYKASFANLISNVDISCCGVSYDGRNLYENFPYAITHCHNLIFKVNTLAMMFNKDRISLRVEKLTNRGWSKFDDDKTIERDVKINSLISEDISNIPYIIEYTPKYPSKFEMDPNDFSFDDYDFI
jgi:hypothetical protein